MYIYVLLKEKFFGNIFKKKFVMFCALEIDKMTFFMTEVCKKIKLHVPVFPSLPSLMMNGNPIKRRKKSLYHIYNFLVLFIT